MKGNIYPAASYQRLYDPSIGALWDAQTGLDPAEDGDHYSPKRDFFEWWYFDAAFDNGYRLVAIFHSSLYNAVDHKPTLDIRLTGPQDTSGPRSHIAIGRYTRQVYRSSPGSCDLVIAGCSAKAESPSRYRVRLDQGEVCADLVYEGQVPGWRPGTGYLFADEASGHYFKWVVPLPVARVTGTISIQGETMQVEGAGYHDHNWGNFVLSDAFQYWHWGRVFADFEGKPWAAVFGDVVGRGGPQARVRPFLMVSDGQIRDGIPSLAYKSSHIRQEPRTRVAYPGCLQLTAEAPGYEAEISLETGQVMEALDFANSPFRQKTARQLAEIAFYISLGKPLAGKLVRCLLGKASYLRMGADASWKLADMANAQVKQLTGQAIFEIMQFE
jgi:predicted secreted hydrolase